MRAIAKDVEKEKAKRNAESAKAQHSGSDKKLSNPTAKTHHENATATKAAELFNTNRTNKKPRPLLTGAQSGRLVD